ncbi:hypothetical protein EMPS_10140 [Entomortierella parvispora]|uniref:Carboxylic ester hydrolase n=1 Tax=Entomortierella parvispora TaxID=205924 RepID=A0A9P3HJI3_9FUNG|nr:hypothetical protein EMPS_10140 [Entomortierella parvispora]
MASVLRTALMAITFFKQQLILPKAPLATDGIHILLNNDVDSSTAKNAFILLSHPRMYQEGMEACLSLGDGGYIYTPGTTEAKDLVFLLNNNSPAQVEVSAFHQFWVYDGSDPAKGCPAVNKISKAMERIPCDTQLPSVCYNSAPARNIIFDDASRQIRVDTPVGQIQGWRDQNAFRFLGIPYAEAPVGNLRFAAPVAKAPFTNTWDAIYYKHICPQTPPTTGLMSHLRSYVDNGATEDEDCLHLNVYTPSLKGKNETLLPVMFYIHGGQSISYSSSVALFEPGNLVSRGGVVVVTINFRLGILGSLEDEGTWDRGTIPGNQALRDQILALQWVQKNIASFGGDPTRVTLFGTSSGATSIRGLLSAPRAWDLYQNAIVVSDPFTTVFKTPAEAAQMSGYFMSALGCAASDLDCARSKPVEDIIGAQGVAYGQVSDAMTMYPLLVERSTMDDDLIPFSESFAQVVLKGQYNTKANILWGTTQDEMGYKTRTLFEKPVPISNATSAFEVFFTANQTAALLESTFFRLNESDPDTVRNQLTHAGTDMYIFCLLQSVSRDAVQFKPTFNFRFHRGRDIPFLDPLNFCAERLGRACHGADIQPVMSSGAIVPFYTQTGDDARFSRQVVDRWTSFAKSGNPNPTPDMQGFERLNPDVVDVRWLPYDKETNPIMELNVESTMSFNSEHEICAWMDAMPRL